MSRYFLNIFQCVRDPVVTFTLPHCVQKIPHSLGSSAGQHRAAESQSHERVPGKGHPRDCSTPNMRLLRHWHQEAPPAPRAPPPLCLHAPLCAHSHERRYPDRNTPKSRFPVCFFVCVRVNAMKWAKRQAARLCCIVCVHFLSRTPAEIDFLFVLPKN